MGDKGDLEGLCGGSEELEGKRKKRDFFSFFMNFGMVVENNEKIR